MKNTHKPYQCLCQNPYLCSRLLEKSTSLGDQKRVGYYTLPKYNPEDKKCLDNKIRDVIYFYIMRGESSKENSLTANQLARPKIPKSEPEYVAFHHFHPSTLQDGNLGPQLFIDSMQAESCNLKNARTILFSVLDSDLRKYSNSEVKVGMYINAPNYSWESLTSNAKLIEAEIATKELQEQMKKPGQQDDLHVDSEAEISSNDTHCTEILVSLIMNRKWNDAYKRCVAKPLEASHWTIHKSQKNGQVYMKKLPIHFACRFLAPKYLIITLIEAYPSGIKEQDNNGKLPIHELLHQKFSSKSASKDDVLESIKYLIQKYPESCSVADSMGMLPIHR